MKKIKLSNGKYVLVDNEDFNFLNQWSWMYVKTGAKIYIKRSTRKGTIYIHRLIMKFPKGMNIDHINGNTFDNRKENLRICSHSENQRNRYSHRNGRLFGAHLLKRMKKDGSICKYWIAKISKNKKPIYLGHYPTEELAHNAVIKYELQTN